MLKIFKELSLDLTEERVVWRAQVAVFDTLRDEDGYVESWEHPFNIAREAYAQEWIDARVAEARAKYGITQ